MAGLTEVQIPTTETLPHDLPDLAENTPLPSDPTIMLLLGLFVIAALTAAYAAAEVILPFVLALTLKLLFQPGMRLLERLKMPRSLAALFLIVTLFAAAVVGGAAVSGPASNWAAKLPESIPRLQERVQFLSRPIAAVKQFLDGFSGGEKSQESAVVSSATVLTALFKGTQHFASGLFTTILILFFLLVSGDTFLRRFVELLPTFKDKRQAVEISQQVEENISAYLVTITFMNAAVGVATGIAVWACGMGEPVLWGSIAFLLNYIPIVGPLLGVGLFGVAGIMAIETFWLSLIPAISYLVIHVVEGEALTPALLARRFTLNPVLVVMSLIFWFWMWGVPGAILAVPMLAITKIICDGVKPLNALGHFLEGEHA